MTQGMPGPDVETEDDTLTKPQSAAELELMRGYPAPPEKRVTRDNMLEAPFNRWSFRHIRELLPTTEVFRGTGEARKLRLAFNDISGLKFTSADGVDYTVKSMLDACYADSLVVLHEGALVYEHYLNGMTRSSQHQMMSVTKSLVGTLALQLIHEGLIDETKLVIEYLPELRGSAWDDATVRHALDMSTGIEFSEVYEFSEGDIGRYAFAVGFSVPPDGYAGPRSLPELLPQFRKSGEHGYKFHYVTPNTDVIGWIIGRVTGKPFAQSFSERIWSRIGVERDAYIITDPAGMQVTGAGFNATARDLARFGQMLLDDGAVDGREVLAPEVVAAVRQPGDQEAFARGMEEAPEVWKDWSYRTFWWYTHNEHDAFTGIGINGQWLYIDPTARVVIVQQSSHPIAEDSGPDGILIPGFHAIATHLMK